MLKVTLISVTGRSYELTGVQGSSPVLAPEDALRGLVCKTDRSDISWPGRAGVVPGRLRLGSLQAEIPFFLSADSGTEMEEIYREFRQGWSLHQPSVFVIDADRPGGPWFFPVVLDRPLPGTGVNPRARTSMTLSVPVFCKQGVATSGVMTGEDNVTVTNFGDVIVYPKITNSGQGGQAVGPSGAAFRIPPASQAPLIDLDPGKLRIDGIFPEGVMPGKTGTWKLPPGCTLEWVIGVVDPWA
ncbi:hypothetical protein HO100_11405 [Corynebacterium ulcerans]|uniref:Phage tail protein n=1 Tax=Corynebacterium ulcerans FRC58 TaxID=1408268 RepID=A0ABM5U209_CORUL|nr:hypothetical protein [Corynebacterium ulcerans]AKN77517.1 Phage tail protein [Corynebacterium ulcerans FRC58]NOL63366.1 hypothetical protein [Corynebacterium ulcerans]NON15692.1 hypothetical protein [Corynebacterium ulcerans]